MRFARSFLFCISWQKGKERGRMRMSLCMIAWQEEKALGAVLGRHSGCGRGNRHCGYGFYGQNKGDCTAIYG